MAKRTGLIALTSAAVIACAVACGISSAPSAATSSAPAPAVAATSAPAPAPSACADLGGTVSLDPTCEVHAVTPAYTVDISFPVDYPDQRAVTDALKRQRDARDLLRGAQLRPGQARTDHVRHAVQARHQARSSVLNPIVQARVGQTREHGGPADLDRSRRQRSYQNFAITDDAVIFFIGQGMWVYEAAGPQKVSVPRTELASALA